MQMIKPLLPLTPQVQNHSLLCNVVDAIYKPQVYGVLSLVSCALDKCRLWFIEKQANIPGYKPCHKRASSKVCYLIA